MQQADEHGHHWRCLYYDVEVLNPNLRCQGELKAL